MRANDRKLLFEDAGIITMRPSDVPTYVEAGAADLGITGKDVLAEQAERDVYELLDLGFGPCRMVFATVDGRGPGRRGAAPARRDADRDQVPADRRPPTSSAPGRQAEIVEVKGSVELAPLTGLVDGIVDLTATGTTLRENGLVDARGDLRLDRAADRQPGRLQAQGARRSTRCWSASVRLSCTAATPPRGGRGGPRAGAGRAPSVADAVAAIVADVRERGDDGAARVRARASAAATHGCACRADELRRRRWRALDGRPVRAGLEIAIANVARGGRGRARRRAPRSTLPEGQTVRLREVPVRRAAVYAPGGRNPYPSSVVMGAVTARAAGRRRGRASPRAPHPVILAAAALCGVDEVYRDGRRAGRSPRSPTAPRSIRAVDVIVGPGSLWVQEAKRQVGGRRRHRRLRRAARPDA